MDKFQNKYRIASARLQNWDYGSNGAYFVTICTQNREHFFGEISDGQMHLNEIGRLAEKFWSEIPVHFPFIELGNFVIMPNHVHGILIINRELKTDIDTVTGIDTVTDIDTVTGIDTVTDIVETRLIASLQYPLPENHSLPENHPLPENQNPPKQPGGFAGNKNPMFHENISRIIRWYKGRCSFEIRKIHADFAWQSLFHDHIIRDAQSFVHIQNYIESNPKNWGKDKFHRK